MREPFLYWGVWKNLARTRDGTGETSSPPVADRGLARRRAARAAAATPVAVVWPPFSSEGRLVLAGAGFLVLPTTNFLAEASPLVP